MAVKGALHVGEAPTNYRYSIRAESSYTTTRSTEIFADAYLRITWGKVYDPGLFGIEVHLNQHVDNLGVETYTYTLTTPWGTGTVSGGGWNTDITSRIEIDDLKLSVLDNCDFSYEFSELRWYVDDAVEVTIDAKSESKTDFDLREDNVLLIADCHPLLNTCIEDSSTPSTGACGNTYSAQTLYHDHVELKVTGGWQFDHGSGWTSDDVLITTADLPETDCSCPGDVPDISALLEDSYDIVCHSFFDEELTKHDDPGILTCTCPPGGFQTNRFWYRETTYLYQRSQVESMPKTSGISNHRRFASFDCGADYDELESLTAESFTYSRIRTDTDSHDRIDHCVDKIDGVVCPADIGGEVPCLPAFPTFDDTICCTYLLTEVTWPDEPVCTEPAHGISSTHHWARSQYFVTYEREGDIYVLRNTFSIPVSGYTEEVQVTNTGNNTSPAITVAMNGLQYLVYTNGDNGWVYRFSPDQARTWSDETVLISDAYFPRICTGPNNRILWSAFVYNSGTSGPGKIKVISFGPGDTSLPSAVIAKDETGTDIEVEPVGFDISFSNDRHGRYLLVVRKSGENGLTHYASMDLGSTYTQIYP